MRAGCEPLCLFRLSAKFVQVEKLSERLIAGKPDLFVKDIGVDRRCSELQIDARILPKRGIVNQLTERVPIVRGLRADDNT